MTKTTKRTKDSPRPSRARQSQPGARGKLSRALISFSDLAQREGVRWYLFGAQAIAIYGVPRTTNDIDITIDLGGRELTSIVAPLRAAGFVPLLASKAFAHETRIAHKRVKPTQAPVTPPSKTVPAKAAPPKDIGESRE